MKIMEFTYQKANGSITDRSVMVMSQPQEYIEGIDMSELDVEAQVEFVEEFNKLQDEFRQKQLLLMQKHDLLNRFRKFIPDNMSNVTVEYV